MIQLAEDIEYKESRKIPLNARHRKIFIEIAATTRIDLAVVDSEQLEKFDESDDGDVVGIDWVEKTRSFEITVELPSDQKKRYILLWNSNEREDAVVAYKITPLESMG